MSCRHALQVKKCRLWAAGGRKQMPTLCANNYKCFAISLPFPDTAAAAPIPHFTFILCTVSSAVTQESTLPSFLFTSSRSFYSAGGVLLSARGGIGWSLRENGLSAANASPQLCKLWVGAAVPLQIWLRELGSLAPTAIHYQPPALGCVSVP